MGIQMRSTINVDVSNALSVCNGLKDKMTPKNFEWCLEHAIRDAGNREVKKIVKQEVVKEYTVTSGWVGQKVKGAKFSGGGSSIACVIPIKGERGTLGGIFPASGGGIASGRAKGNTAKKRLKRGGAKVKAQILRGGASTLPDSLPNQGGNAPFRLPNGAVMTRKTSKSHPLVRVVGRAVPQMVDKHFESKMQNPINDYIIKRMDQLVKEKMGI